MTLAQVITVPSKRTHPLYPFLSQPPPQKMKPTQPLPSPPTNISTAPHQVPSGRRRSATTSAITAWASDVYPGSPAPCSPYPRSSPSAFCRRSSISRSVRIASASFLNLHDTPTTASRNIITPSLKEFSPSDLALVGYTSVFFHFPRTPASGGSSRMAPGACIAAFSVPGSPDKLQKGLKRFRSLGTMKPARRVRSRSIIEPPLPLGEAKTIRAANSAAVSGAKRSKYAKFRPPPLTNELALAQLMDGGKLDDHATRFAHAQAKAAGATKINGQLVGVGSVWRDGEGGIWRDEDEEWEFAHLLGGEEDYCASELSWVKFGSDKVRGGDMMLAVESRGSVSTEDSDLQPRFAMHTESDPQDDLALLGSALVPTVRCKPGMSVLAIPSRSRRSAKHLRKPEFLLDAFPMPSSPTLLSEPPFSPHVAPSTSTRVLVRPLGKARRRPTPLKLTPPSPAFKCPTNPSDAEDIRRDFLDESFAPTVHLSTPSVVLAPRTVVIATAMEVRKPSALKGILKVFGKK